MERKRLIQEGLAKRAFPPRVAYPELSNRGDELAPLAGLFDHPVVVWVPEAACRGQKPECVVAGCRCTPRVKEYRQRVVEDVEGKQDLLYIKYQCAGSARTCFSTISPEYLQSNVEAMVHFSFILGSKSGYSKPLLEMIHDGMMSPNGLSSTVANIRRRRQTRYYKLYTLFADRIRRLRLSNPDYVAPTPPTVAEYCASNAVVDTKVLTAAWMEATAMYGPLCELLMQKISVRKVLRVDHSAKFCKKLKIWDGPGQRASISDAKLLLLIQNEVGQIVGRRLTRSENNEETAALLEAVKPTLKPADDEAIYLVSDNANGVRGMVQHTFGGSVEVKQDPFHVMMRVKEKLASAAKKKWISKELMSAMYTVERKLRPPKEMEEEFRRVANLVSPSDLSCTEATWQGCIDSNAAQIKKGDLFVENNDYAEAHTTTRIVATSQLEGFHSGLKKLLNRALSAEVGLRILDVFIVQHNLRVGAKFGRNAAFGDFDFVSLAQAAILCRGTLPDSPQLAFVSHMLSGQMPRPQYRSGSSLDFEFSEWLRIFDSARVVPDNVEAALARPRRHWSNVRELLLLNSSCMKNRRLSRSHFMSLLHLEPQDSESSVGFSLEEYELLRQVRKEQAQEECIWSSCPLVTTIMFNIAVDTNTNSSFKLRQRSYTTIVAKLKVIADEKIKDSAETKYTADQTRTTTAEAPSKSDSPAQLPRRKLFALDLTRPEKPDTNTNEQAIQIQLFKLLRSSKHFTGKKKLFIGVYKFASCVCDGIWPKSESNLTLRWGAMKRAENRGAGLKIKLRVAPGTIDQLKKQQEDAAGAAGNAATGVITDPDLSTEAAASSADDVGSTANFNGAQIARTSVPDEDPGSALFASGLEGRYNTSSSPHQPAPGASRAALTGSVRRNEAPAAALLLQPSQPVFAAKPHPTMLSEDDIERFRTLANSIPNVSGKWEYLHSELLKEHPHSQMSANALRCRLRERCKRGQSAGEGAVQLAAAAGRKRRRATSCSSCQKKRKRCGDTSVNPSCMRAAKSSSTSLDAFFSTLSQ